MSRYWQRAIVGLVAAWAVIPAPLIADVAKDLKPGAMIVMTEGPLDYKPKHCLVIRNAEELVANSDKPLKSKDHEVQQEMSLALAKLFKVDAIDWDKQMVVGIITGGGRADAGKLSFVSLLIEGKSLTVHYNGPAFPDHNCAHNSGLALIPRVDGDVKFVCDNASDDVRTKADQESKCDRCL